MVTAVTAGKVSVQQMVASMCKLKHTTRMKPLNMSLTDRKVLWLVYHTHSDVGLNFLAGEPSHLSDSQVPSLSDTHTYKSHDWSEWTEQSFATSK